MQAAIHLHRGDGTQASIGNHEPITWLEIVDNKGSDMTIFIPWELKADAEAFAESINTYCRKRIGASA